MGPGREDDVWPELDWTDGDTARDELGGLSPPFVDDSMGLVFFFFLCVFTFKAVLHWVTWADYTLIGYIAPGRKKIELIAQACIFFFTARSP